MGDKSIKFSILHANSTNENMSLHYVNSTTCMAKTGIGGKGALMWVICCIPRGCPTVSKLGKYT